MVLLPSRQVQFVPLGLYWENRDGWTPRVGGNPAEKMRVGNKESKKSRVCMNENWVLSATSDIPRTWKRSGCLRLFTKHFASRLTPSSLFWLDKWHSTQNLLLLPAILIPCQSWSFSLYPVSGVVVLPQSTAGIHFKRCVNSLVQLVLIGNVASVHSFIHLPLSTHLFSIISYTIRIQSDLRLVPSSSDFSLLTTSF